MADKTFGGRLPGAIDVQAAELVRACSRLDMKAQLQNLSSPAVMAWRGRVGH